MTTDNNEEVLEEKTGIQQNGEGDAGGSTGGETEELTPEQLAAAEAEAEAMFEAGFTGQDPADLLKQDSDEEVIQPKQDEGKAESSDEPAPKTVLAGYTEDEIKTLLDKASKYDELSERITSTEDKLFGRYGELNRTLKEVQEKTASAPAGVRFAAGKLERLSRNYPELAEDLIEDFNAAFGSSTENNEEFDARLQPHIDTLSENFDRRLEKRLLTHFRPDWDNEQKTPEFAEFLKQLSDEDYKVYKTSWNADQIYGYFEKFDQWKEDQAKAKEEAERKAAEEEAEREANKVSRLDAAMTPRGSQADHTPSEDDAFEAGFNSVKGG